MGAVVSNLRDDVFCKRDDEDDDDDDDVKASFEVIYFQYLDAQNRSSLRQFLSLRFCQFMHSLLTRITNEKYTKTQLATLSRQCKVEDISLFYVRRANLYAMIKMMMNPFYVKNGGGEIFRDKLDILKGCLFWNNFAIVKSSSSSSSSFDSLHANLKSQSEQTACKYGIALVELMSAVCHANFTSPSMAPIISRTQRVVMNMCSELNILQEALHHIEQIKTF